MFKKLYYILLQRLYVYANKNITNQGKVYMFHEIGDKKDTYTISENDFVSFINYLYNNKTIVDIDTMQQQLNDNNVVISFDDAYASVYEKAYPVLKKMDVPYYIFICGEYLNKKDYLNSDMIKEMLKDSKCILGSHSIKHDLSRFKSGENFLDEINKSKESLQKEFNTVINDFAFPYGSVYAVSDNNINIAKKVYKNIFMTFPLPYNQKYGNVIPRININYSNFMEEMK